MNYITIQGARENNLKDISLDIPKNQLVVLTGLSGSGKSTIAFETLQKECQRQYMESMGMVTENLSKPKVDRISGLSPSISVDQHLTNRSPRSTVGTMTEVFTYLRVLFARLGERDCLNCGQRIQPFFQQSGNEESFQSSAICPACGHPVEELNMSHFSFNKPEGACPTCTGLGVVTTVNIAALVDESRSIVEGAVKGWDEYYIKRNSETFAAAGQYYGFDFDPQVPIRELGEVQRALLYYGAEGKEFTQYFPGAEPPKTVSKGRFEGIVPNYLRRYAEHASDQDYREKMEKALIQDVCGDCKGTRLRAERRNVTIGHTSIVELVKLSLLDLDKWIKNLPQVVQKEALGIATPVITELTERLERLINVGVGYLSMERPAISLSGGEAQRIRLASLLGSGLTGVLYVLDEPTTGLHPADTERLVKVLKGLRDLGNTVLVIEHDVEMMWTADYLIDIGPGAGRNGGEVVAVGTPEEVAKCEHSITGRHLAGVVGIERSQIRRKGTGDMLKIMGAKENNLKNIDVNIPLGTLTVITGVSGSGKTTVLYDILDRAAQNYFSGSKLKEGAYDGITGWEHIDKVITIDQAPIGRTPRSNAATYTDVFTPVRNFYAKLPEAQSRKLQSKHFSFNVPGGRCEKCQGAGVLTIEMQLLPPVEVPCSECHGKRFKSEILEVKYQGHSVSDLLNLTIEEAYYLFREERSIAEKLSLMMEVGLGYLQLGQPATTLSGGEAQRIKLSKELGKRGKGHTLYLLDEPTTGLHPHDVCNLTSLLQRLVDGGNTVLVVEHNLDLIRTADWLIDLGPEGGDQGGELIAAGRPEEVALVERSKIGKYLNVKDHAIC